MGRTRANLFSLSSSSVILDLGDCETFSVDYMEVIRFLPCFRGGLFTGADISPGITVHVS